MTQGSLQNTNVDVVDRSHLEESLVELELSTGCTIRRCQDDDKLVELIIQTTKAIADAPFKRKNVFSFHDDLGPGPSKKVYIWSTLPQLISWSSTGLYRTEQAVHDLAASIVTIP